MMDMDSIFQEVKSASRDLALLDSEKINEVLLAVADAAIRQAPSILQENAKDLAKMNVADPMYDRLKLTQARLEEIAQGIRGVAKLPSPLGRVLKDVVRPNGIHLRRVSVPFGVIGVIYEARPNVSFDVFSLCIKSGNACVLKGGSNADASNRAIVEIIHQALKSQNVNPHIVELLPAGHESAAALLHDNNADKF
jgi:Gamma-glutamyl phosphate reductase